MKRTEAGSALLLTGLALDKDAHLSDSQLLPLPGGAIVSTSCGRGEDYIEKWHGSTR